MHLILWKSKCKFYYSLEGVIQCLKCDSSVDTFYSHIWKLYKYII